MYYYGIIAAGLLSLLIVCGLGKETLKKLKLSNVSALIILMGIVFVSLAPSILTESVEIGAAGLILLLLSLVLLLVVTPMKRLIFSFLYLTMITGLLTVLNLFASSVLDSPYGAPVLGLFAFILPLIFAKNPGEGFFIAVTPVFLADAIAYGITGGDGLPLELGCGRQLDVMIFAACMFLMVFSAINYIIGRKKPVVTL